MKHKSKLTIAIPTAALAVLVATALFARMTTSSTRTRSVDQSSHHSFLFALAGFTHLAYTGVYATQRAVHTA